VITMDQDVAWRLFSKGLPSERARREIRIAGDESIGRPMLGALAIMA
jgi:hypothetical protein